MRRGRRCLGSKRWAPLWLELVCVCVFACMCTPQCVCARARAGVGICVCVCVCLSVCLCVCVCVCDCLFVCLWCVHACGCMRCVCMCLRARPRVGARHTPPRAQVDADWILRRLERWGRRDGMPFVGPEKAALLRALVAARPGVRVAAEVGAMAGYSGIYIAQVGVGRSGAPARRANKAQLLRRGNAHTLEPAPAPPATRPVATAPPALVCRRPAGSRPCCALL